jgi:SAM-dependent methyltransferase
MGVREKIRRYFEASYLRRIVLSLRDRGAWKTVRLAKEERWYELRHGIQISGIIPLDRLAIDGDNKLHGCRYEAVNLSAFRKALSFVDESLSGFSFIDLGCGKGFALILAAEYGFEKLIGVEFSPQLAAACRANLGRVFGRRAGRQIDFEVLEADVTEYRLPPGDKVVFMFNPFDASVVRDTFENVRATVAARPEDTTYVVYVNAAHRDVLSELGFHLLHFEAMDPLRVYRHGIAVYRA